MPTTTPNTPKAKLPPSLYAERIMKLAGCDAREARTIEGVMRNTLGTLDALDAKTFASWVRMSVRILDEERRGEIDFESQS